MSKLFTKTYSVAVASKSVLKLETVKRVFEPLSIKVYPEYHEFKKTPPQPIGITGILYAATTRIENSLKLLRKGSHSGGGHRWIVALENGLVYENESWYDRCMVLVYDIELDKYYGGKEGVSEICYNLKDYGHLTDKVTSSSSVKDSNGNIIGYSTTFGSLISQSEECSSDNWMLDIACSDRRDQMQNAIDKVFGSITSDFLKTFTREIPDFPSEGVLFQDMMPMLYNYTSRKMLTTLLANRAIKNGPVDVIMGPELRGCIFGPLVADHLKLPFVPFRKKVNGKSKLPPPVHSISYGKEYGKDTIEMDASHFNNIKGVKVAVIDDILATGGSLKACAELVEKGGGEVASMVVINDVPELRKMAQEALSGYKVYTAL